MNDDEGVILVCFTVEDLGADHDPESFVDKCSVCAADVYVANKTLLDIGRHHPGVTPNIVCSRCAPGAVATVHASWADTPQQRRWRRLFGLG